MAQIKITKEELEHDEVLEASNRAILWLKAHGTTLLIVLALIFGIYLLANLRENKSQQTLLEANNVMADVQKKFDEARVSTDWATLDRQEKMLEVVALADQVIAQYPDSPVARQALYIKGKAYYTIGDTAEASLADGAKNTQQAIDIFKKYVAESEPGSFDEAMGNIALAYAYENAWQLQQIDSMMNDTLNTFDRVIESPDSGFLRYEAMVAKARILAYQDRPEDAIQIYRDVLDARYKPLEAADENSSQTRMYIDYIKRRDFEYTIVGTARNELTRLGVDVEKEYPVTLEEK